MTPHVKKRVTNPAQKARAIICLSLHKRVNALDEASKFVGYHADIRGLLTCWLTAPTLLVPS